MAPRVQKMTWIVVSSPHPDTIVKASHDDMNSMNNKFFFDALRFCTASPIDGTERGNPTQCKTNQCQSNSVTSHDNIIRSIHWIKVATAKESPSSNQKGNGKHRGKAASSSSRGISGVQVVGVLSLEDVAVRWAAHSYALLPSSSHLRSASVERRRRSVCEGAAQKKSTWRS